MSNNTVTALSDWQRDAAAYDPSARMRRFTFQGATFVARSNYSDNADQWPIVVRREDWTYVTTVSNWKRLPEQLAARLGTEA